MVYINFKLRFHLENIENKTKNLYIKPALNVRESKRVQVVRAWEQNAKEGCLLLFSQSLFFLLVNKCTDKYQVNLRLISFTINMRNLWTK